MFAAVNLFRVVLEGFRVALLLVSCHCPSVASNPACDSFREAPFEMVLLKFLAKFEVIPRNLALLVAYIDLVRVLDQDKWFNGRDYDVTMSRN